MMTQDSRDLLRDYRRSHSEEAFRGLVARHSPLVYGTALRKLEGDRAAAQDVTQEVFTLLARKAARLDPGIVVPSWLYRQACRRAANHARTESRRRSREQVAIAAVENSNVVEQPEIIEKLDHALERLHTDDRDALVLRFFEGLEYRSIATALGLSEEAARKRIRRALDKLGAMLRHKVIEEEGVAAGARMMSLAALSVPIGLADSISGNVLKEIGAQAGWQPFFSLVKPIAAGVVVSSLVGTTALALRTDPVATAAAMSSVREAKTSPGRHTQATNLPEHLSLDDLITEIKRAKAGPGNVLTKLRLAVVLDRIRNSNIPDFIALGNQRLTPEERSATYPKLLETWLKEDPQAAVDFCMLGEVGSQVDPGTGTNLLNNLFSTWLSGDRDASQAWLLARWEAPQLTIPAFQSTLRDFLAMKVTINLFATDGVAQAFDFVRKVPSPSGQVAALKGLVGMNDLAPLWSDQDAGKRRELYQAIKHWPDPALRDTLVRNFWTQLGSDFPKEAEELASTLDHRDRFEMALGQLGITRTPGPMIPQANGGFSQPNIPVTDREAREQAVVAAGLDAGLPPTEVASRMAEVMLTSLPAPEFFAWFDTHETDGGLDEVLAARVRKYSNVKSWSRGQEMVGMEWASRISNEELRLTLCRGAFRQALFLYPDAAMAYLQRDNIAEDIRQELEGVLEETP